MYRSQFTERTANIYETDFMHITLLGRN